MGRIIVFTSEDLNSKQLLKALESRKLPYDEVSLSDRPSRITDLASLVNCSGVPQMFINTRAVGGLNRSLKELKRWDNSSRFESPLQRYEEEVAPAEDPSEQDPRLLTSSAGYKVVDTPPAPIQPHIVVKLVTGKVVPLREATELMKEALPQMGDHKYKGVTYHKCFSGHDLISSLRNTLDISDDKCVRFAKRLLEAGILHHVNEKAHPDEHDFLDASKEYYRLQCYANPLILNSYRIWRSGRRNCVTVVEDLQKRLSAVENSNVDDEGLLDYLRARADHEYTVFEDAACELQNFSKEDLGALDENNFTAMALNIYSIMLRYAYLKVGIPLTESDRMQFLGAVQFYLAGDTYSLKDWIEVLRGKKSKFSVKKDYRAHFAMNMGAYNGSGWSSPLPRFTSANLDVELNLAGAVFCSEERNLNVKRNNGTVTLSSVFKQYRGDFCKDDKSLLKILQKFASGKQESDISTILDDKEKFKVVYKNPELGFHVSAGPWYNQTGVETLHEKKKRIRRPSITNKKDPLGGSDHSMSSNQSSYSWR
mmetsp:Transcript_20667/g.26667  ORF Transcript_20667/g.26667 Transcript_20667/m.26667 type:complete len:538 (+) Transcript_20667:48-1661(+)